MWSKKLREWQGRCGGGKKEGEGKRAIGDRGDEKIRRGVNGPLNGLGGSKHCQREEINGKLVADNPPSVFGPARGPPDIRISCVLNVCARRK